jgi:hypothetical protein
LITEENIADTFIREIAREFILDKNRDRIIDEKILDRAMITGKGNWVDVGIIYEMLESYSLLFPDVTLPAPSLPEKS